MFYSQFILAKKGPLGTIWIAAHLERKLRKNQVADTDIGVSVDSILCPDVPIALRLSSHLLLGVVRIYNRKVNYLFDDCSEALLKIKQAFRATAVDLPPEQSKAPYHSITLPETFDLDDFELPDNEIFQGNYVDHHVSSREQITLQDTMDGVAYSTTRFGLDERFGDGDTSGLDLDEELFLDKVGTSGHVDVSTDPQASVQPMSSLKQGDQDDRMPENSEPVIGGGGVVHFMDDAQAPRTPGLVEEPNISNAQETSACDDHFESDYHHLTDSIVKENVENMSGVKDIDHENKHVDGWSLPDDKISHLENLPENGYHPGEDIEQLKPHTVTAVTVEPFSPDNHAPASGPLSLLDKHVAQVSPGSDFQDKTVETSNFPCTKEHAHEGVIDNDEANTFSVHESLQEYGTPDGMNVGRSVPENFGSANTFQQTSEAVSENHRSSMMEFSDIRESAGIRDEPLSSSKALDLDKDCQGRPCNDEPEGQPCEEGNMSHNLSSDINGKTTGTQVHVLRPCNAGFDQPDSSNPEGDRSVDPNLSNENAISGPEDGFGRQEAKLASEMPAVAEGEACHVIDGSEKILTEENARECALDGGIGLAIDNSNDQVDNVISGGCPDEGTAIDKSSDQVDNGILGGCPGENVNSPAGSDLPAPEKLLSVTDGPDDLLRNFRLESTPKDFLRNDDGDAGSNIISGKKRSYTESTLTEQSLNSVESSRIVRSRKTVESIPDDDDLLSSILVGRRSSVLKVKPTPSTWEITSVRRTNSTPRSSAVKRKVLVDDTMVLHGDTIRQQLMDTEDIRRVRKKAPCTRPEISSIQKQFLEDDMFIEPLYTGMSSELASLQNQSRDLRGIRISINDIDHASLETSTEIRLDIQNDDIGRNLNTENAVVSIPQDTAEESGREQSNEFSIIMENCERETGEVPQSVAKENEIEQSNVCSTIMEGSERGNVEDPSLDMDKLDGSNSVCPDVNITELQVKTTSDVEQNSLLLESQENVAETEANMRSSSIAVEVNCAVPGVDESSLQTDRGDTLAEAAQVAPADDNSARVVQTSDDDKTSELDTSLHVDAPNRSEDQKTDDVSLRVDATGGEIVEEHHIVGETCDHTAKVDEPQTRDEVLLDEAEGDTVGETVAEANSKETENDPHSIVDKDIEQSIFYSFPGEVDMQVEDVLLGDGERPTWEAVNPSNTIDTEFSAAYDHDDLNYPDAGNDTEFLNFDEDEEDEPIDDFETNEEVGFTENSGWSSRTRAVANYLQTTFFKQAGYAKPTLSMDNLLIGKTRKEASRMFFEALVLKTKDYIQVEQGNPFESIMIKPRTKLIKADF